MQKLWGMVTRVRCFVFKVLIKIGNIFTEEMLTLQSWVKQIQRI
jgi:hypothetical protein